MCKHKPSKLVNINFVHRFVFLSPGGQTFTCACPEQYVMEADGKTCIANCTDVQFQCPDTDAKCIPQLWFCDGEDDCKGGEDEPADNMQCRKFGKFTSERIPLFKYCQL